MLSHAGKESIDRVCGAAFYRIARVALQYCCLPAGIGHCFISPFTSVAIAGSIFSNSDTGIRIVLRSKGTDIIICSRCAITKTVACRLPFYRCDGNHNIEIVIKYLVRIKDKCSIVQSECASCSPACTPARRCTYTATRSAT